jgi:hypothetical protein
MGRRRSRAQAREKPAEAEANILIDLLDRRTHEDADKVLQQLPPVVLGMQRSAFLLIAAGAADLVGHLAKPGTKAQAEFSRARSVLHVAAVTDLLGTPSGSRRDGDAWAKEKAR